MVEFLSLYLGLVWGIQPVHLRVEAPVVRVELRLHDRPVAVLMEPPWSVDVDFGEGPVPSVLVAEAWNREGESLGSVQQVLNLPRPDAEASLALDTSGPSYLARLTWQSLEGEEPEMVTVKLDGEPLSFVDSEAISLPGIDGSDLHVLEAEVRFSERLRARAYLTFGADFVDVTRTGLTAIPVQMASLPASDLAEIGRFFRDESTPSERLLAIAVEKGPADLLVVRDRAIKKSLEAIGLQAHLPRRLHSTKWARVRYLKESRVLDSDDRFYFLNPVASEVEQSDFVSELFLRSAPLSSRDSSLFWASVRTSWGDREGEQQLADAVAVAGLHAARQNGRRAVLLLLSGEPDDRSSLSVHAARRYLRALRVPFFVWRVGEEGLAASEDPWQVAETVSDHQEFLAALRGLKASLASQVVVWLDGIHLPQRILLEGAQGRLEFSTAPIAALAPASLQRHELAAPSELLPIRLNQLRAARGLPALRGHEVLDRVAQQMAGDISRNEDGTWMGSLEVDLVPHLETQGYEAEFAAKSVQWGSASPEELLDAWVEQENSDRGFAFDPSLREIGVGLDRTGGQSVVVVILALSRDHAFRQKTVALDDLEAVYGEMLDLVNQARKQRRLGRLYLDSLLTRAAQDYADTMLADSFYGHVSPQGADVRERVKATGYRFDMTAENLAQGPMAATEVISAWLESPHHRDNILNPRFRETGFGLAFGENQNGLQIIWVQCLAKPRRR